ncbi:MAG: hypothetical protein SVV80_10220 [Planctomycetota bacterium]|nr:hypothetical protein [Planctomycetota bacterium]
MNARLFVGLTVSILCFTTADMAWGAKPFYPIRETGQIFDADLKKEVSGLGLGYSMMCIWPTEKELAGAIPLASVPGEVVDCAAKWVRTVLKEQWVPPELQRRFIAVSIRRNVIPPADVDHLIARYRAGAYKLQIMEDGGRLAILIIPEQAGRPEKSIEEHVSKSAQDFLRLPENCAGKIVVTLQRTTFGKDRVLGYGTIDIASDDASGTTISPSWWHRMWAWSDGRIVYLQMLELPRKPGPPRARPGMPKRFRTIKMIEEEVAKLSNAELVDMVLKGDTLHKMVAVERLRKGRDGKGWRDNLDVLLSLAEKTGTGDMIVEGLVRPEYVNEGDPTDLKAVDKYIDFLEMQLKNAKPCVSPTQAIRSLGQVVKPPSPPIRRRRIPMPTSASTTEPVKAPYGTARVAKILISQLEKKDWRVREAAVRWLGNFDRSDPQTASKVVAALKSQISKEEKSNEKQKIKDERKAEIHRAIWKIANSMRDDQGHERGGMAPTRRRHIGADTKPAADKTP